MAQLTTMQVGGPCDYLVSVRTAAEVKAACDWADEHELEILVLGEGSNLIVSDQPLRRLVVKMEIPGFEVAIEDAATATVEIGAGEHWDNAVEHSVKLGLAGIEAMSMIPGTAGAAPVQNAGAYGQEIADTLVEVEAYDREQKAFVTLMREDCGFGYRSSAFKGALAGRYIIVGVTLRLSKLPPKPPTYASLKRYLDMHHIQDPNLKQIRSAVMSVRAKILPDPSIVPNTGSFFKNPIVGERELQRLLQLHPDMPYFAYEGQYKLAAGWMLDQCGFKGAEHFGLRMHKDHALVITNPHHAGYTALKQLVALVVKRVHDTFGVTLEPEPQFIS